MSSTLEEFGQDIQALIGDYQSFVGDLLERLDKAGVNIEGYHITHLLYRTEQLDEYEGLRDKLHLLCREFVETQFNGRPVSVMTLRHPLELPGGHSVTMIELPAPRAAHLYPSGLESIGVLVNDGLSEFEKHYAEQITGVKDHGVNCKPAFMTFENGKTVKFYEVALRDVIILQGWRFEEPLAAADSYENRMARIVNSWRKWLYDAPNWQELIRGVKPKDTFCGPIYELPNPIARPHESLAIADMRAIKSAAPHYHTGDETEIYMVIEGTGQTMVGGDVLSLKPNTTVVTPPETAHFVVPGPGHDLVLAVINTPPFSATNNIELTDSKPEVHYDKAQFEALIRGR